MQIKPTHSIQIHSDTARRDILNLSTEKSSRRRFRKHPSEIIRDSLKLSPTKLREKYAETASSHRNMLAREKKGKAKVCAEFKKFPDFLRIMGKRPSPAHTLDRIDHSNPMYSPDNCRWADKKSQARNRSSTIMLTVEGETLSLAEWAERTNQSPDTLRNRRRKNWSDIEVVYGRAVCSTTKSRASGDTFDRISGGNRENARFWRQRYLREFTHLPPNRALKEMLEWLADSCSEIICRNEWELRELDKKLENNYVPLDDPYCTKKDIAFMDRIVEEQRSIKDTLKRVRRFLGRVRREQAMRAKIIRVDAD